MQKVILLLGMFFVFLSCATQKPSEKTAEELNKSKLEGLLQAQKLDYSQLKFRAKINPQFGEPIPQLNGTLYSERGKKFWLNVSKFGLSFARGLADSKGFQAYVKLDRTFYKEDYTALDKLLGISFLDLEKLEQLLLGRYLFLDDMQSADYLFINNYHRLTYSLKIASQNQPVTVKTNFDANGRIINSSIEIPEEKTIVNVDYQDWGVEQGIDVPRKVKVLIKNDKEQSLQLDYSNFEKIKMETPFSIPSRYKQKTIK